MSVTATPPNPLQLATFTSKSHEHGSPQLPPGHLELLIATRRVGLYHQPPEQITSDALAQSLMTTTVPSHNIEPTHPTGLLTGPLVDFQHFSNEEKSQWLIDIAHDICDPAQKRGQLVVWRDQEWRDIHPTHRLIASTYHYIIERTVSLTKISARVGKSRTDTTGHPSAIMANRVKDRDGHRCWMEPSMRTITNSHLCPKRMGDHLLRVVYNTFVQTPPRPALSIYDEICGISLSPNLDTYFDEYEIGLRSVSLDEYECHWFRPDDWPRDIQLTTIGAEDITANTRPLHGTRITPPPLPEQTNYYHPPPGLIRWHYLQCVIRKFAHTDYKSLQHIYYSELALPMEGDSDDEGTDSEFEWPSAPLDLGRAMLETIEVREEQQRVVAEWVSAV